MPGATSGTAYPSYIAFRTADPDGHVLTVVAELEPDDGSRFPWALCYQAGVPWGDFRKVPGNYMRLGIDAAVAQTMIDVIMRGGTLPPELVSKLPTVD